MSDSGPPKVTCAICNQEVMKKQTRSVDGKRVCKSHEGVEEKADAQHKARLDAQKKRQEERNKPWRHRRSEFQDSEPKPPALCCWVCGHEGIYQQELLPIMRQMMAWNISPPPDEERERVMNLRNEMVGNRVVVDQYTFSSLTDAERNIVENNIRRRFLHSFSFMSSLPLGFFPMCIGCSDKLKIKTPFERRAEALRKVPLETIALLGTILDERIKECTNPE